MIWLDSCGSTNAELMARDLPHGTGLAAREQTAGRGRLGRTWEGATGNLAMSVLLRPQIPAELVPLLTIGTGVVLAEHTGFALKWPNDLLDSRGRKLAGVLAEAEWAEGELRKVVIGIGINLVSAPFPGSASLAENGVELEREKLAESLRIAVAEIDVHTVRERWMACNCTVGRQVVVGDVHGTAIGLAPNGALLIDRAGVVETVTTGDLGFVGLR